MKGQMTVNIMGERIPSAAAWILMLAGRPVTAEEFKDVVAWQVLDWDDRATIEVLYRSGREEVYAFSHECVAGGMMLIDPREEIMRTWDGERPQPVI